jgi:hypothetical protein
MGERPKYPQFLVSAFMRFTLTGLARRFVVEEPFVTEHHSVPQYSAQLSSLCQLLVTAA